jgi:hypothetical protein
VYARYTITDPHTGKLLEEFNGALPPHITTNRLCGAPHNAEHF